MAKLKSSKSTNSNGGALGFEANLWAIADKLRCDLDAGKYISASQASQEQQC